MIQKISRFFFQNRDAKQMFLKNATWLLTANFLARFFKFFLIPYAAQTLGPEGFGTFTYGISLATLYFFLSDMGLSLLIPRELPQNKAQKEFISAAVTLKTLLLVSCSLFFWGGYFFVTDPVVQQLYVFLWIYTVFDQIKKLLSAFLQAHHRMEHDAIPFIIESLITSAVGILFLYYTQSIILLAIAYIIGSSIALILLIRKTRQLLPTLDKPTQKQLTRLFHLSLPFLFTIVLNMMLITSDTLLIKWWIGADAVGYYQAGLKIFVFAFFIAQLIMQSLYPLLSAHKNDISRIRHMVRDGLSFLLMISVPLSIGGILMAEEIIFFLYGTAYLPSVLPFQILLGSLVMVFCLYILNRVLLVYDREKTNMLFSSLSIGLNISINILLLPRFGIVGVAIGTLIAKLADLICTSWMAKKILTKDFFPLRRLIKYISASIIMGLVLHYILLPLNYFIAIPLILGGVLYMILLVIMRETLVLKGVTTLKAALKKQPPMLH